MDREEKVDPENNPSGSYIDREEELIKRIQAAVEEELTRKFTFIKIVLGVLVLLLAPAATITVKTLIDGAVNKVEKQVREDLNKLQNDIDEQLVFSRVLAEATALEVKPHMTSEDVEYLLEDLKKISQIKRYKHSHEVEFIVEAVTRALIQHNLGYYLEDLEPLFPWAVSHKESINTLFLRHYAFELLKDLDVDYLKQSELYKNYKEHLQVSRKHKAEENILPYEVLIGFHINHRKKNDQTEKLLTFVPRMSSDKQATFLWKISETVNPHFWERDPSMADYRISDVTRDFLALYGTDLKEIALEKKGGEQGVKAELIERFRNAFNLEEEHLGKYVLSYFYQIVNAEAHFSGLLTR